MNTLLADYVVTFLADKGVRDLFGYQGTMISYFVDAIGRCGRVRNHSCYNEQGAAFAACGSAQFSGNLAVAYATSGPGAVNLLSGVADAYYDSLPVLFITGQVNTYEYLPDPAVRQHGFQECDIVSMAKSVTKYAVKIDDANMIRYELEKAYWFATHGRKGSVLIDIPMNLQRAQIDTEALVGFTPEEFGKDFAQTAFAAAQCIENLLNRCRRPAFVIGNGVNKEQAAEIADFCEQHNIPLISSLLGKGLISEDQDIYFGYLGGAYGIRCANMIAAVKADLLICLGVSLVTRQTGTKTDAFAPDAEFIRVDIDKGAFARKLGKTSHEFCTDIAKLVPMLKELKVSVFSEWLAVCRIVRSKLKLHDDKTAGRFPNRFIEKVSSLAPQVSAVAVDVGQHMMWIAQSFKADGKCKFLFSGGHGAMGYSLPAAIGASYLGDLPVLVFAGDGAFQMNIQELEWVAREKLPIKIFVMNNHALGMIRVHQKVYLNSNYEGTSCGHHYSSPDFAAIGRAYGIRSYGIGLDDDIRFLKELLHDDEPLLVAVNMPEDSFAYPKTLLGNPVYNQEPEIPADVLAELLAL